MQLVLEQHLPAELNPLGLAAAEDILVPLCSRSGAPQVASVYALDAGGGVAEHAHAPYLSARLEPPIHRLHCAGRSIAPSLQTVHAHARPVPAIGSLHIGGRCDAQAHIEVPLASHVASEAPLDYLRSPDASGPVLEIAAAQPAPEHTLYEQRGLEAPDAPHQSARHEGPECPLHLPRCTLQPLQPFLVPLESPAHVLLDLWVVVHVLHHLQLPRVRAVDHIILSLEQRRGWVDHPVHPLLFPLPLLHLVL
mmetsp:Transcript_16919/g.37601  ORF Transcript_16919/g.37601 Transcript_16919/m.37601 type:complete len:251 (-) Transcript_16919:4210-4962(-)